MRRKGKVRGIPPSLQRAIGKALDKERIKEKQKGRKSKKPSIPQMPSQGERLLAMHLKMANIEFVTEHMFHPVRKWRMDFAILELQIGIEVMGGGAKRGRHHRNDGYKKDCEKMCTAASMGWVVLYVVYDQIKDMSALQWIKDTIKQRELQLFGDKKNS